MKGVVSQFEIRPPLTSMAPSEVRGYLRGMEAKYAVTVWLASEDKPTRAELAVKAHTVTVDADGTLVVLSGERGCRVIPPTMWDSLTVERLVPLFQGGSQPHA